jgi:DNA-binding MarR family transcriptional regulator
MNKDKHHRLINHQSLRNLCNLRITPPEMEVLFIFMNKDKHHRLINHQSLRNLCNLRITYPEMEVLLFSRYGWLTSCNF